MNGKRAKMIRKIVKAAIQAFDLTPEEARKLYKKTKKEYVRGIAK